VFFTRYNAKAAKWNSLVHTKLEYDTKTVNKANI